MIDGEAAAPSSAASAAHRFDLLDAAIGAIAQPVTTMQRITWR